MFDTDEKEDRKTLPITAKQLAYAQKLAMKNGAVLPWDVQQSRATLSAWIEKQSKAPALRIPTYPAGRSDKIRSVIPGYPAT